MLPPFVLAAQAAAPAHFSNPRLVTSNGFAVGVFSADDPEKAVLDRFNDHLYQQVDAASDPVRDLLYDTYFGLRAEGWSGWLTATDEYDYEPGTNVMRVDRSAGNLRITELAWGPMDLDLPALAHVLRVENAGAEPISGVEVFSLHNFHVGGGKSEAEAESIRWEGGALIEQGVTTGLVVQVVPLATPDRVGCTEAWSRVNAGEDLDGACEVEGDDMVGALQWTLGELAPGEVRYVGAVDGFASGGDTETVPAAVADWAASRDPEAILDAARAEWETWLGSLREPVLSVDEAAVYAQALVFLRQAQVREEGDSHGQIVASLPVAVGSFQHLWNIAWVRDGAYSIAALAEAGAHDEAAAALRFFVQEGKSGAYASWIGVDDYALSVCRTYGDGSEWSDEDADGPNIELDNFGLYLWALGRYVDESGDTAILDEVGPRVLDGVADVLVSSVDPDRDLIIADSSIWERHWNGNQKHFTYTSAWAVRGLGEAADLAGRMGDSREETYRETAARIAGGIETWLVRDDGVLVGNLEEYQGGTGAMDLAAADAFANGALDPRSADASIDAWKETLAVASGHGYFRNDDGDLYDQQEWVMVDLRLAAAMRLACREEEAAAIEAWVTEQATANHLAIPELMDPETGDYAGPAPMMGFGSALYVLAMLGREEAGEGCGGDTADTGETGDSGETDEPMPDDTGGAGGETPASPKEGCGCASGGGAGGPVFLGACALGRRGSRGRKGNRPLPARHREAVP